MPKREEDYIGSLDVQNRYLKVLIAKKVSNNNKSKIEILSYADRELHPWSDAEEMLGDMLEELLSRAETKTKLKNINYRGFPISLESKDVVYELRELTIPIEGTMIVDDQLLHQIDEDAISDFESRSTGLRLITDYIVGYKINGNFYPDILGQEIDKVNVVVAAVYLPRDNIKLIEQSLDLLDIDNYVFEYSPISASYFIPENSKKIGCFQIHGGWQDFTVLYWYMDKLLLLKKLPYGVRMLSKDIEKVFKVSRDVAENLIFKEFNSIREEDIEEGVIKVTLKNGESTEISKQFFQRVLEARMDEISEQLKDLIDDSSKQLMKNYSLQPDQSTVYLTGNFVNLNGTKTIIKKYFSKSNLLSPSVLNSDVMISGDGKIINDTANLPLFGNLLNYSNEILIKSQPTKREGRLFSIFKRRRRNQ